MQSSSRICLCSWDLISPNVKKKVLHRMFAWVESILQPENTNLMFCVSLCKCHFILPLFLWSHCLSTEHLLLRAVLYFNWRPPFYSLAVFSITCKYSYIALVNISLFWGQESWPLWYPSILSSEQEILNVKLNLDLDDFLPEFVSLPWQLHVFS